MMKEIKFTRDGLNNILCTVPEIYKLQPIDEIMKKILYGVLPIIKTNEAFIMVDNLHNSNEISNKTFYKGLGRYNADIEDVKKVFEPDMMHYAGLARTNKKIEIFDRGAFFPLISDEGDCIGIIYFELNSFKEIPLMEIFTIQASSSINNAFLHSLLNIKNEELTRTFEIIKKRFEETINTLRLAVDAKDQYTRGHSDRVAYYAVELGTLLGTLTEEELELLRVGGIFHDIGKIGTNDDILLAERSLSNEEFKNIQKHPLTGAYILSALSMFEEVVPIVKCHHERIDGRGYPNGLKGDEIPLLARIVAIADAFDAMTSTRVYRQRLDLEKTLEQLISSAGTQFDAQIVTLFVSAIKDGRIEAFG
jgi:putative nucleotidyltransferase with HDIG domain